MLLPECERRLVDRVYVLSASLLFAVLLLYGCRAAAIAFLPLRRATPFGSTVVVFKATAYFMNPV